MSITKNIFGFLVTFALLCGCIEPYDPPTTTDNPDFIVVDGFVNLTTGVATVTIKRSIPLLSDQPAQPELNAMVYLYDDQGGITHLTSVGNGVYATSSLALDVEKKHSLYFKTLSNREYQSDFVTFKKTPPIDSLTWRVVDGFVEVNVNTHDPTGNSRFYKWNFIETYEYNAPYTSQYMLLPGNEVKSRTRDEMINTCWKSESEKSIVIGTSSKLSEDRISNKTVRAILGGTTPISKKYSILVEQNSISPKEYQYWLDVQKTTETLGGLFDPMPSEVIGNVFSLTDPNERVIGYFSGGEVTSQRLFIDDSELRDLVPIFKFPNTCQLDTVLLQNLDLLFNQDRLVNAVYSTAGMPVHIGYTFSAPNCIDCRLYGGGDTIKPDFWQE